jgi:bacterioferritin (cytochrome b1)
MGPNGSGQPAVERQKIIEWTDEEILARLNALYVSERQSVVDYDAHMMAIDDLSLRLGLEMLRDRAQDHALRLAARIRELGGEPSGRLVGVQPAGSTPARMLAFDLGEKQRRAGQYLELLLGIIEDARTAKLVTQLLLEELQHLQWLKSAWLAARQRANEKA